MDIIPIPDPVGLLIDRLPIRRAKNRVRDKIVELGLVNDVKELRKKRRSGKSTGRNGSSRDDSDDDDSRAPREGPPLDDSEDDEDSDEEDDDDSDDEPKKERRKRYGFAAEKMESFSAAKLSAPLRELMNSGSFLRSFVLFVPRFPL